MMKNKYCCKLNLQKYMRSISKFWLLKTNILFSHIIATINTKIRGFFNLQELFFKRGIIKDDNINFAQQVRRHYRKHSVKDNY